MSLSAESSVEELRLRRYVHESGWQRSALAAAAQRMGAHSP